MINLCKEARKTRYSVKPREGKYVKTYKFLSFAEKVCKKISSRYGQK